eukprot:symbB.v1.2.002448.t2/scaffold99.1/size346285/4
MPRMSLSQAKLDRGQELEEYLRPVEDSASANKALTILRRKGSLSHPEDVRVAIRCLGDSSLWREGLQLLKAKLRAPYKPSPRMYSAAVTILDDKQWALALELLQAAKQAGALDIQVLNSAMAVLNKAVPELASALFRDADKLEVQLNTCSQALQRREAVWLLKAMWREMTMPNTISYKTAIWACSDCGSWTMALELLREVWLEGLVTSMYTFTGAILACARAGEWQRSLILLADARTQLLSPDVPSHAAAIHACSEAAQWQQTLALLKDMSGHKTWPDRVSFNSAILSCARGQQWRWSLRLLSGMLLDQVLPDAITYRAMVDAYKGSWKWEEALAAVGELERFTGSMDVKGRTSAMGAMGICRQWAWAVHLLSEVSGRADVIAWNSCISACADASSWQQAWHLHSDSLHRFEATLEGFNAALTACSTPKAWRAALGLLDEMAMHGLLPDLLSITSAIGSCTSAQWRHVLVLSGRLEQRPDAILETRVLCELGKSNWPLALDLLQGGDSQLATKAMGCAQALAVAEASNAALEGRVWLQRAQGCLQRGTSPDGGTWSSHEAVTASELLVEYDRLDSSGQLSLGRRVLKPVLWRLSLLEKATSSEAEDEFAFPRGSRRLTGIRFKTAARWKRRYLEEMAFPSRSGTSLQLSDMVPGGFSLGSLGTGEALTEVGLSSSSSWYLFGRRATRGALLGQELLWEAAEWPTYLSLSLNRCQTRHITGQGGQEMHEKELPATFLGFSAHSERQALLLALKHLRMAGRITPLQPYEGEVHATISQVKPLKPLKPLKAVKAVKAVTRVTPPTPTATSTVSTATASHKAAPRRHREVQALIRAEASDTEARALQLLKALEPKMTGDARQWLQLAQEALELPSHGRYRAAAVASAIVSLQRSVGAADIEEEAAGARRALGDALVWRCQEVSRSRRSRTSRTKKGFKRSVMEAVGGKITQADWSRYFYMHKEVVAKKIPELDFKERLRKKKKLDKLDKT